MLEIQKRNQNWLPGILDDFFYGDNRPLMNVIEDEKEYRIEIVAPGFTRDEVSVSQKGDHLDVSLVSKEERTDSVKYIRREFVKRNYRQSFIIPENVNMENISASLENGILLVSLPKQEPKIEGHKVHQISVS